MNYKEKYIINFNIKKPYPLVAIIYKSVQNHRRHVRRGDM